MPSPSPDGRLQDVQAARDVVGYNQTSSLNPRGGIIWKWQSPVAVHVQPPVSREYATDALDYWRSQLGIDYRLTDDPVALGITFVESQAGIPAGQGSGRVTVGPSDPNNRARTANVLLVPGWAACTDGTILAFCPRCDAGQRADLCRNLFRHELGHALGFFEHGDEGLMSVTCRCTTLSAREKAMMAALYSLPFGARVQPDGTWSVVVP